MPKTKSEIQFGDGYWAQVAGATAAGLEDVIRAKKATPEVFPGGLVKESRRFLRLALPRGPIASSGSSDKVYLIAAEAVAMTTPTASHTSNSVRVSVEHYDGLLRRLSTRTNLSRSDLQTASELQQFLSNFYRSYETHRKQRRNGEVTGAGLEKHVFV